MIPVICLRIVNCCSRSRMVRVCYHLACLHFHSAHVCSEISVFALEIQGHMVFLQVTSLMRTFTNWITEEKLIHQDIPHMEKSCCVWTKYKWSLQSDSPLQIPASQFIIAATLDFTIFWLQLILFRGSETVKRATQLPHFERSEKVSFEWKTRRVFHGSWHISIVLHFESA